MNNEGTPPGEVFEDRLENYDPKSYGDDLEAALAEAPTSQIQHRPHASIAPDESVAAAVKKLASEKIGCLMVEENGKLVGVFTEREVLNKVALEPHVQQLPVRQVMTANPIYVYEDDPTGAAPCVMAVNGFRHVPVVDLDEHVLGIVSPQRVTSFLLKHFNDKK